MQNGDSTCIPASVGILTYNNEKTLRRCLESVSEFCEVIVADGGSTDGTLEIAKEFGCKVISQTKQHIPIDDFSRERNHLLDNTSYDWFFYLDADEYMSDDLKHEIKRIRDNQNSPFLVYNVPYFLVDKRGEPYKQFKIYHQARLFNKKSGARFIKPIHERINFDTSRVIVGELKHPWYVPLDETDLVFGNYKRKVNRRIHLMMRGKRIESIGKLLRSLKKPLMDASKQIIKIVYLRIRYPHKNLLPLKYELFRLYSYFYTVQVVLKAHKKYHRWD